MLSLESFLFCLSFIEIMLMITVSPTGAGRNHISHCRKRRGVALIPFQLFTIDNAAALCRVLGILENVTEKQTPSLLEVYDKSGKYVKQHLRRGKQVEPFRSVTFINIAPMKC